MGEIALYLQRLYQNIKLNKAPLYVIIAALLFYFTPSVSVVAAMSASYKIALSLFISPFIFESLASVVRNRFLTPSFALEEFSHSLVTNNETNALAIINQTYSPEMLMKFGLKLMERPNEAIFNSLLARLSALNPDYLTFNNNFLFRAAIFHQSVGYVRTLMAYPAITNNAHANYNQALKEACINGNLDMVELLLTLETVREHVADNYNEAVRLADEHNHHAIFNLLLNIPEVNSFSAPQNWPIQPSARNIEQYYLHPTIPEEENHREYHESSNESESEDDNDDDVVIPEGTQDLYVNEDEDNELKGLAQAMEGATTRLNARQNKALNDMKHRYSKEYNRRTKLGIFKEIKDYLFVEYQRNPAKQFGLTLPLEHKPFWARRLPSNDIIYFQHHLHCAYRYLFLDNHPWLDEDSENYMTSEDELMIAYMWLAATDSHQKLPKDCSVENLLNEFVEAMYELCRSHNYDNERPVIRKRINPMTNQEETYTLTRKEINPQTKRKEKKVVMEHFDDLKRDRPTCEYGVELRSTQFFMVFLNDRPETRPLTKDIMKTRFREQMIEEGGLSISQFNKLKAMNAFDLKLLHEAVSNVASLSSSDNTPEQVALLKAIAFTQTDSNEFIKGCEEYYGAKRLLEFKKQILDLAKDSTLIFAESMTRNINELLNAIPDAQANDSSGNGKVLQFSGKLKMKKPYCEPKPDISSKSSISARLT